MRLNIACGPNVFPYPGWINYDREDFAAYFDWMRRVNSLKEMPDHQRRLAEYVRTTTGPVVLVQDVRHFFHDLHQDNSIEAIYLGQMIEHLNPITEAPRLIRECHRMLKPGGILRITTPDLELLLYAHTSNQMGVFAEEQPAFYKDLDRGAQLAFLMFGSAGADSTYTSYEGHQFCYGKESMRRLIAAGGFALPPHFHHGSDGTSADPIMQAQVVDAGMSHSFVTEAIK